MSVEMPDAEEQAAMDAQKQQETEAAERARATGQPASQRAEPRMPTIVMPPLRRRMRLFFAILIGPKVDAEEWRKRLVACHGCPIRDNLDWKHKRKSYCGGCSCWRWWPARIERICKYLLFRCPLGRHPGQNNAPGGCSGCGGG